MVSLLTTMNSSYMIADGSLLQLYRNCSTGLSDVDFAIDLEWWRNNSDLMGRQLRGKGFRMEKRFGHLKEEFGYAEAWKKGGLKVDLYSNIFDGKFSVVGFWVGAELYPCYMRVGRIVLYQWLEGVVVRGPYPIEEALKSAYGSNYLHPIGQWVWDRDAFVTGYCRFRKRGKKGKNKKKQV